MKTVAEQLSEQVREGELYEKLDSQPRTLLCLRPLLSHPGGLRGRLQGALQPRAASSTRPTAMSARCTSDPIEKKPFFHALPGTRALSFGMLGCDLHCAILPELGHLPGLARFPLFARISRASRRARSWKPHVAAGARSVVSTYNEPLITSEWAVAIFREARAAGLVTGFVSNGNATPQVLEYLRPWVDLYKVDLKSFDDRHYHELGGRLRPILDSIRRIHQMGFWLEIVTLVVPGFNDSVAELTAIADFWPDISPDIPWHVTAFHEDYKMFGQGNTGAAALQRAAEIGRAAGLRYVYAGNLPGQLGKLEDTHCPECGAAVVERRGFRVLRNRLTEDGALSRLRHAHSGTCGAIRRHIPPAH